MPLLERPNAARGRFFPEVDRLLQPDESQGSQFLASGESPFRLFKPRAPEHRAAGLLWLFRNGMQAELEDRWRRADFFWDEADRTLRSLERTDNGLVAAFKLLLAGAPAENGIRPENIAPRVIDEIFIDTHAAFYNGRVKRAGAMPPDNRALSHLDRIKRLLPLSEMSLLERAAFLRPTRRAQFETFKQTKAWKDATKVAREMLEAEPDDAGAQERFIDAVVQNALAAFSKDNSESGNRREAMALQAALRDLEGMRPKMLLNEDLYGAMSQLQHMCAIRLANSNQLSQALLSVQMALTIRPDYQEAEKTRAQLLEMMKNLQAAVKQLEEDVRRRPNARLNEHGLAMQREALAGFGPLNQFVESKQAPELAQAAEAARNVGVWRRLGLAPPVDHWADRASSLLSALAAVFARQPKQRAEIVVVWKEIVATYPNLADVDDEKVVCFLANRLVGDEWEPAETLEIANPPEPSNPPVLTTDGRSRKPGGAPFMGWIYSGQDLGMKLRWATILVLIAVGFSLWLKDEVARTRCDRGFAALTQAAKGDDASGVMAAAEQFLSSHPAVADRREREVILAYRSAMIEWFTGLREVADADQSKISRFRALTAGKLEGIDPK